MKFIILTFVIIIFFIQSIPAHNQNVLSGRSINQSDPGEFSVILIHLTPTKYWCERIIINNLSKKR